MKNLSIEVKADGDMNTLDMKTVDDGFTNFDFSIVIYKLLMRLYKLRKKPTLIAAQIFLDEVKR